MVAVLQHVLPQVWRTQCIIHRVESRHCGINSVDILGPRRAYAWQVLSNIHDPWVEHLQTLQ